MQAMGLVMLFWGSRRQAGASCVYVGAACAGPTLVTAVMPSSPEMLAAHDRMASSAPEVTALTEAAPTKRYLTAAKGVKPLGHCRIGA